MIVKLIGITGGTGAGKSTLCTSLLDKYPEKIGIVQLDDYFKPKAQVPTLAGFENWDHPDALFFDKLVDDLKELKAGHSVLINTKNERLNPDYAKTDKRIIAELLPKPIMLVEGFLVLWDKRVRNLLNTSIWLEVQHDTRWERRVHFKIDGYEEKVLKPMQEQYAEPTKKYAGLVIDATDLTKEQVLEKAEAFLKPYSLPEIS